jgi:hypothetical protein
MKESLNSSFDSISPSAKSLLLTKALTTIPFAREAARLIWGDNKIQDEQKRLSSIGFLLRLIHFEKRYLSVDKAIAEIGIKNILEFSSGFSFRGLSLCKDPRICYIDTDLPQILENKKIILKELIKTYCNYPADNLSLQTLNVLDEDTFVEIIKHFPTGPVSIVNEGLLVYLDEEQKRKLCEVIRNLLSDRGGYWITADIYIKEGTQNVIMKDFFDERGEKFLEEHHVKENKFESFKTAEVFFNNCGFEIYKKIETSASRKLLEKIPKHKLGDIKGRKKIRETWILKTNDLLGDT